MNIFRKFWQNQTKIYTIGCIFEFKKNDKYVKVGSEYLLKKNEAYCVIDYLKKTNQWNFEFVDKFKMIDTDFLFEKLKLFPYNFKKNNYKYSYDEWDVTDCINDIGDKYFIINSYLKNSNKKYYSYWILKEDIENGYISVDDLPRKIFLEDVLFLIKRYERNKVNTFDFNRFDYFIEDIMLEDYVIDSNEEYHLLLK